MSLSIENSPSNYSSSGASGQFVPGPFDVICARGKQAYNHEGNRFFRQVVARYAEKYSKVESKLQRSMIVTEVLDTIRARGNGFLKQNREGEWVECADVMCREKIGQHFRNALADKYKSNSKSRKRQSTKQPMVPKGLIDRLRGIIFSSKAVNRIVERLTFDVIFIEGESSAADDAFYKKTLASNATLLQAFKEDAALVQQFKCQLTLGQQQLREQNEHQRSGIGIISATIRPLYAHSQWDGL